jgi:hypothetical protein
VRRPFPAADVVITLGFFLTAIAVLLQAREWPFRGALFPLAAGWLMLAAASLNLALLFVPRGRRAAAAPPASDPDEEELPDVFASASRAEWIAAVGWMGSFFLMLWLLGAFVAIPLFATLYLLVASRESPWMALGYAFVCWLFVYGLFDRVLHVPLPRGALLVLGLGS